MWKRIAIIFIIFYFLEAVLFWKGLCLARTILDIPHACPYIYPLGFWGLFAFIIYRLIKGRPTVGVSSMMDRVLAAGIPLGVVGNAFLVMMYSNNITLGHITMFGSLFIAAVSMGAVEGHRFPLLQSARLLLPGSLPEVLFC